MPRKTPRPAVTRFQLDALLIFLCGVFFFDHVHYYFWLHSCSKIRTKCEAIARTREAEAVAALEASGKQGAGAGLRCQVKVMWAGKTYVLFTYER